MAVTMAIQGSRRTKYSVLSTQYYVVPATLAPAANISIAQRCRETLENAGLVEFDEVMHTTVGRCLRVLPDRENWYLPGSRHTPCAVRPSGTPSVEAWRHASATLADGTGTVLATSADGTGTVPATLGMYLKKHRARTWTTRIAAACGTAPPLSPGRVEAENALALQSLGIDVMPLMAFGEKLHADGRLESFLLTEELVGYCELQEFIQRRFPSRRSNGGPALADARSASGCPGELVPPYGSLLPAPRSLLSVHALHRLIVQVADIARRFHAAGFNHRDFYACHFLTKEISPGRFDVRLIDLQRVQQRRWFRRRWIVKDLAQLASMSPDDRVGCREKVLFLRTYLGVQKLRPQDKQLVREILGKLSLIRRRPRVRGARRHKP